MSVGRDDLEQGIKGLLQSAVKEDLYKIFFSQLTTDQLYNIIDFTLKRKTDSEVKDVKVEDICTDPKLYKEIYVTSNPEEKKEIKEEVKEEKIDPRIYCKQTIFDRMDKLPSEYKDKTLMEIFCKSPLSEKQFEQLLEILGG